MEDSEFTPKYQYFDLLFKNRILGVIILILVIAPIVFTYTITKTIQLSSWALVLLFGFLILLSDSKRRIVLRQDGTIRVTGFLGISKTIPVGPVIYHELSGKRYLISGYLLDAHTMLNEETLHNALSVYSVEKNALFIEYEDYDINKEKKIRRLLFSLLIIPVLLIIKQLPALRPVMENYTAIICCLLFLYLLIKTVIVLPKAGKKQWAEACEAMRYQSK